MNVAFVPNADSKPRTLTIGFNGRRDCEPGHEFKMTQPFTTPKR
jgi:hypothetical protein